MTFVPVTYFSILNVNIEEQLQNQFLYTAGPVRWQCS